MTVERKAGSVWPDWSMDGRETNSSANRGFRLSYRRQPWPTRR